MFCPKCGNPDQSPESYCRQCGSFLPDLDKPKKKAQTPMQNVTANIVLSGMTVVACTVLAILLYVMLGFRENTHPLIYVTAGLLIAMGCWHIQTFWRSLLLRKHFKLTEKARNSGAPEPSLAGPEPRELPEANFEDMVPPSVVERTTRKLKHDLPKAGK